MSAFTTDHEWMQRLSKLLGEGDLVKAMTKNFRSIAITAQYSLYAMLVWYCWFL